jgi:hypothetical protein
VWTVIVLLVEDDFIVLEVIQRCFNCLQ